MKVEFYINIKASNSVGTVMTFKVVGKGDCVDYSLASMDVSNKLSQLLNEEFLCHLSELNSLKK